MLRTFLARTLSTAASSNPASKGTGFVTRKVASNEGLTTRTFPKTYFARLRYKAPFFNCPAVVDGSLKNVSLHDYKGKNLVLVFYPMDLYVNFK
ncbi:hypothetical protein HMI54_003682 [Coelomomyces lativittatus]|nr:hypothetical protein HMI54_003682 [Coelomomyces lativittatus]